MRCVRHLIWQCKYCGHVCPPPIHYPAAAQQYHAPVPGVNYCLSSDMSSMIEGLLSDIGYKQSVQHEKYGMGVLYPSWRLIVDQWCLSAVPTIRLLHRAT